MRYTRADFRYRLHERRLPGTPDLVLPRYHAAVFFHGCFWHGHDCRYGVTPATNTAFWLEKIERNQARDRNTKNQLLELGWRVLTVWECSFRGVGRRRPEEVAGAVADFLCFGGSTATICSQRVPEITE
ncbi:very short patch repair endonuclease [Ancylobacter sp. TS-1]|uniref:very short patch repair endonuclease n=1 Tax=Ancylobacter sp. TS-1 TaxID=1850374 RepID=UPI00211026D2|nr:very short patch repair endonuclease [Ancylobacter sp. TS-1]